MELRKKVIQKIAITFLLIILFFTFFSNTINNLSLPLVTTDKPINGALINSLTASGAITEKEAIEIYADGNRKVNEVKVKVGDTVTKGQELIVLDNTELVNQLKDEKARLDQKKLNLSKLQEAVSESNILAIDKNIELAKQKLQEAEAKLKALRDKYSVGQATQEEVNAAETNVNNAKMDYDIAQNNKEKTVKDNGRDVNSLKLDIEMQERKVNDINDKINNSVIKAEADGEVLEVNAVKNRIYNNSQPAVKLSNSSGGYTITFTVDSDSADLVKEGSDISITLDSTRKSKKAKVETIHDNVQMRGQKKDIVVSLSSEGVNLGVTASINVSSNSKAYNTLIPIDALREGDDGYYVYVISQKKGTLGDEYFARQVKVEVEAYDSSKAAVSDGVMPMDKVIVTTDKTLSDGDQVRLQD
jgi:multidrug efflux pump subunit AcrA (membrane-fusion protein)